MKYRIKENQYACLNESDRLPYLLAHITTYAVQVRRWWGWVTVKEFDEGHDREFAKRQAIELIELIEER